MIKFTSVSIEIARKKRLRILNPYQQRIIQFNSPKNNVKGFNQHTLFFAFPFPAEGFVDKLSFPRLSSGFKTAGFDVFPFGLKNDRISCRKRTHFNQHW